MKIYLTVNINLNIYRFTHKGLLVRSLALAMSSIDSTRQSRQLFPTSEMSKFHLLNTNSAEKRMASNSRKSSHTSSTGGQRK